MSTTEDLASAADSESAEIIDDDDNISDLIGIEEILARSSASDTEKLLEFEMQMFLDMIYNDGLVICAK